MSPDSIRALVRENFRRIGEAYCCAVKTSAMSDAELTPHFAITGLDRGTPAKFDEHPRLLAGAALWFLPPTYVAEAKVLIKTEQEGGPAFYSGLAAYREGALRPSPRPWRGYLMLLEEAEGSTTTVAVSEPHFKVFPEFRGASYAKRYEILCQKLVREGLYDAACLILSDSAAGKDGAFKEPNPEIGFRNFAASLAARGMAHAKTWGKT